jgi:hypothetical protein
MMPSLQLTQERERRRHFAAGVLIDAMQTHERIEDEQTRRQFRDGTLEAFAIHRQIQSQRGRRDDLHIQCIEAASGGGTDAFEPSAHDMQGIFGGIQQHAPGMRHLEASQARTPRRHGEGQIKGKEGLATLGLPADDADRFPTPQVGDEPTLLDGLRGQTPRGQHLQCLHRRRPVALACAGEGVEKLSKKSFSSS